MNFALECVEYHREELMQLPLYWPQIKAIELAEEHIANQTGEILCFRSARQTMKNECAGMIQERALVRYQNTPGAIYIRTAPTYRPQIVNSKLRLERFLNADPLTPKRKEARSKSSTAGWFSREGFIFQLGEAQIHFLSAQKEAQIVGSTASIALDCDEGHKIDAGKFGEDLDPMRAFNNVPCFFWGVAADGTDLLQENIDLNKALGKPHLNLDFPADIWCELRPQYKAFYDKVIQRYGETNPWVLTQYKLISIASVDKYLRPWHLESLLENGIHRQLTNPSKFKNPHIVVDIGGEDLIDESTGKVLHNEEHDRTAIIIFDVDYTNMKNGIFPTINIMDVIFWVGKSLTEQQNLIAKLIMKYGAKCMVDGRGVGEQLAGWLKQNVPRVKVYKATGTTASSDCYNLLGWLNNDAIHMFKNNQSVEYKEFVAHCESVKYEIYGHESMRLIKGKAKSHFDFVRALQYITRLIPLGRSDTIQVPA